MEPGLNTLAVPEAAVLSLGKFLTSDEHARGGHGGAVVLSWGSSAHMPGGCPGKAAAQDMSALVNDYRVGDKVGFRYAIEPGASVFGSGDHLGLGVIKSICTDERYEIECQSTDGALEAMPFLIDVTAMQVLGRVVDGR